MESPRKSTFTSPPAADARDAAENPANSATTSAPSRIRASKTPDLRPPRGPGGPGEDSCGLSGNQLKLTVRIFEVGCAGSNRTSQKMDSTSRSSGLTGTRRHVQRHGSGRFKTEHAQITVISDDLDLGDSLIPGNRNHMTGETVADIDRNVGRTGDFADLLSRSCLNVILDRQLCLLIVNHVVGTTSGEDDRGKRDNKESGDGTGGHGRHVTGRNRFRASQSE